MALSVEIAVYTERILVLETASRASQAYPERATKPMVAKMARTATTTMSSATVKAENFLRDERINNLEILTETESEIFLEYRIKC